MSAEERDFFAHPLTREELDEIARRAGGVRNVFAFNSPSFKKLDRDPASLSDEELSDLILSEPRMLRRPLMLTDDGRVLAGGRAVSEAG